MKTKQTGTVRQFVTPAVLEQGKPYKYMVKITYTKDGKPVTIEQKITVEAGKETVLDFTGPALLLKPRKTMKKEELKKEETKKEEPKKQEAPKEKRNNRRRSVRADAPEGCRRHA